jgi:hypothetical protein
MLHLGKVEVRSQTSLDLLVCIVEEEETEVKERTRHGLPIDGDVTFLEMPASSSDEENGVLFVQLVLLAGLCVLEGDLTTDSIIEVELAVELICPGRGIRVWPV